MIKYLRSKTLLALSAALFFAVALNLTGGYAAGGSVTIVNPTSGATVPPQFTVTGTAPPNTTVDVRVSEGKRNVIAEGKAMADANGNYSVQIDTGKVSAGTKLRIMAGQAGVRHSGQHIEVTRQ